MLDQPVELPLSAAKPADNFHLWSETYDRTLDDVFVVQEEIAGAIAEELQVSLGLAEGGVLIAPTADLGAYELFLEGRARMRARGSGVQEAVQLFEAVVARDSNWAPGWAGLAQAYSLVPFYGAGARVEGVDPSRWSQPFARSEQAAKRALELDPLSLPRLGALGELLGKEGKSAEVYDLIDTMPMRRPSWRAARRRAASAPMPEPRCASAWGRAS